MAIVRSTQLTTELTDPGAIAALLAEHGLAFEQWPIQRLAETPRAPDQTPEEHVLSVFAPEVERLKAERGYKTADVIALTPETPQLETLLAKFDREHLHTEDEVRFVVSGRGVFSIRGQDGHLYDVEVQPGDLLTVPEGTHHAFTLCDDRQIQCIRLFTDMSGWVAHYVGGDTSTT